MSVKTIQALPIRKPKPEIAFDGTLDVDGAVIVPEDVAHIQETDPVFLARVGALRYPSTYSHRMFQEIARTQLSAFKCLQELLRSQRSRLEDAQIDCCCDALQKLKDTTGPIFTPKSSSTDSPSTPMLFN
jgi:hypothetical protein